MRLRSIVVVLGLSLSACGGGGGSSGESQGQLKPETTTSNDGRSRQINSACPFTQVLSDARNDARRI